MTTEIWFPLHDNAYALRRDGKMVAKVARGHDGWHWATFDGMWTADHGRETSYEAATEAAEAHVRRTPETRHGA